jgi:nucleotide-binding universal stress UspA family protein
MYKSILLSVDLNHERSWKHALPAALELSKSLGAELHLVTVVPGINMALVGTFLPEDFEKQALQKAGETLHAFAMKHIPDGVRGKSHVAHGEVRQEILKAADTLKCDLIVMAPHRRGLQDILIGPNTDYVAHHAKQSVLVIRGDDDA